jgi:AcrR family transcriptional regulator
VSKAFEVTEEVIKEVEECGALGMSMDQISWSLGVNPSTLYKYKSKMGALNEAISRGRARGIRSVTTNLREQISDGNAQSTMFYLKNRSADQWNNDTQNVAKIQINLSRISDSELLSELREDPVLLKAVNIPQIEE